MLELRVKRLRAEGLRGLGVEGFGGLGGLGLRVQGAAEGGCLAGFGRAACADVGAGVSRR